MCFESELPYFMNIEGILMDILNTILVAREMKEAGKNEEMENILYTKQFF